MSRPGHISLCPETCNLRHNSTLLALANCADNKHFDDCGLLKTALYSKLKQGWNPHTAIDDVKLEFRYPLIHWACALGKAEALQWLIKMRLKPSMQCRETGECPLHFAVKMLYCIRRTEHMPVDRICNRFSLILRVLTDHEPNVLFLGDLKGNSVFHACALKIAQQEGISSELEFYENCLKHLMTCVERVSNLKMWNNTSDVTNNQSLVSTALNSQNDEGNTVLHVLAQKDISYKTLSYLVETFSEDINKQLRNNNNKTPAEIAVSCGAKHIATYLGVSPKNSTDNLHKKLPAVFQLYTQDIDDSVDIQDNQEDECVNGVAHRTKAAQSNNNRDRSVNGNNSNSKKPNLRLNSYVQRDGFYCGSSSQDAVMCDSDGSVDASSPSLLSCESNSFPETKTSVDVLLIEEENVERLTNNEDSQTVDTVCLDEPSCQYESDFTEDELLLAEEQNEIVTTVSNNAVCKTVNTTTASGCHSDTRQSETSASTSTLNITSEGACNGLETAQCDNGLKDLQKDAPQTTAKSPTVREYNELDQKPDIKPNLASLNGQPSSAPIASSVQQATDTSEGAVSNWEINSPLVKFIKEEVDVASLIRAKLLDRKEKSRSELCEIQKHFCEKNQKENDESNQLQQMINELETLKASRRRVEERKKTLVEELKMIDEETVAMERRCDELEHLIVEHTQKKQSFFEDKESLSRQCAAVKRKVEEYESALMEISAVESGKKPKQEPLDK